HRSAFHDCECAVTAIFHRPTGRARRRGRVAPVGGVFTAVHDRPQPREAAGGELARTGTSTSSGGTHLRWRIEHPQVDEAMLGRALQHFKRTEAELAALVQPTLDHLEGAFRTRY